MSAFFGTASENSLLSVIHAANSEPPTLAIDGRFSIVPWLLERGTGIVHASPSKRVRKVSHIILEPMLCALCLVQCRNSMVSVPFRSNAICGLSKLGYSL